MAVLYRENETSNLVETLPWIDFSEVFAQLEERGRAEGEAIGRAEGRTERDMEIARKAFARTAKGASPAVISQTLMDLGILENIVTAARRQADVERAQSKKRDEPKSER